MEDVTFTLRLEASLQAAFAEVAEANERTTAQHLRHLMRAAVEAAADRDSHDARFRDEVQRTLSRVEAGDEAMLAAEDVAVTFAEQRAALLARADQGAAT